MKPQASSSLHGDPGTSRQRITAKPTDPTGGGIAKLGAWTESAPKPNKPSETKNPSLGKVARKGEKLKPPPPNSVGGLGEQGREPHKSPAIHLDATPTLPHTQSRVKHLARLSSRRVAESRTLKQQPRTERGTIADLGASRPPTGQSPSKLCFTGASGSASPDQILAEEPLPAGLRG